MCLINSSTVAAVMSCERDNLRQIDEHGNDLGPVASGDPAKIVRFLDRGFIRFGLIMKDSPRSDKYDGKDNAVTVWSAS